MTNPSGRWVLVGTNDPWPVGVPVGERAASCELCGGPVPMAGLETGETAECLACGALHVVEADEDCPVCGS